ncbi:MAG: CoA transferase [Deltaproteobacteria bacterium]|nr:MAG: CoA transferase [Deltaproteobacteria bacterium]
MLELGQFLAAPFATSMLAAHGAEVIKVEAPGSGDPIRRWRRMHGDTSVWWYAISRNKKCITCNLRTPEGQDLVRRLVESGIDVVVENFRPGTLERWNLGYEDLRRVKADVVLVRISGYGQTGPYASRPGFANVAEAFGGLRHLTAEPGRPPVRSGLSLGDTIAGLHAAFAALAAIYERDRSGQGQEVDVALYESVFNLTESLLPEYDLFGHVRMPTGAALEGVVPSNSYPTADGKWVAIGANADGLYVRLMELVGRPDLATDPALATNDGRVARADEIDAAIAAWTRARPRDDVLAALVDAGIPAGPINDIADIVADPHVRARGIVDRVTLPDGTPLSIVAPLPRFGRTPGRTEHPGPALGEHNREVYGSLGLSDEDLAELAERGVV